GCFERSNHVFRERCTGANWEISTANMMSNWSLGYLGEWAELARRGPDLLAEAEHSGNLYRIDGLSISHGVFAGLAADQPERVRQQMKESAERWTPPGFQVQHYFRLLMRGFVDLYAGDAASYWEHLRAQWPALRGSLLLTVEDIRYRMSLIRGFAALAVGDDPGLRRAARGAARVMKGVHAAGAAGIAGLIRAALAHREGSRDAAVERLHRASLDFDQAGMSLFAAAARWRLGQVHGGRSRQELENGARQTMDAQRIQRPERVLRMLAPGFPEP
ncbi:MAG TPA: hypothetical protein VND93_04595, partial [Myxococcales bacterium]|nr:hypothetical protein [Myxococcales bacterium]